MKSGWIILSLVFLYSCTEQNSGVQPFIETPDPECRTIPSAITDTSSFLYIGNWQWIQSNESFGGLINPVTEGYEMFWAINTDSIYECRNDIPFGRIKAEFSYGPHPFAGSPLIDEDSTYLFYGTGIVSFYGDTMEIYQSYVDGKDYWFVRKE